MVSAFLRKHQTGGGGGKQAARTLSVSLIHSQIHTFPVPIYMHHEEDLRNEKRKQTDEANIGKAHVICFSEPPRE